VGRSEERGVRHSTRRGHFNQISGAYGMNETQNWIRIREPVKSAARTDTVTGIRLTWCRMIDDQMHRRKNRRMRPITQIECGELTDSHAITMHSSQAAMRVVALTVGFIPESYFPRA
jgi:hypothetical protein